MEDAKSLDRFWFHINKILLSRFNWSDERLKEADRKARLMEPGVRIDGTSLPWRRDYHFSNPIAAQYFWSWCIHQDLKEGNQP